MRILARIGATTGASPLHQIVGTHYRLNAGILDAYFKGEQIGLAGAAVIHDDVSQGAASFLIIEGEMLDVAENVLVLNTANVRRRDFAGQDGIFALGFKGAAVARLTASEVDVSAEVDIHTEGAHVFSDH